MTATYTLSEEGITGQGNFTADPYFVDTLNGIFQLKSLGGRYDPTAEDWVIDDVHSPAIDAGDPTSPYANEPVPNGNRINLGCYGNTYNSSKSFTSSIGGDLFADKNAEIAVYPNPTSGTIQLNIDNLSFTKGEMAAFNVLGENVFQTEINHPISEIHLNLPEGIYFYQVRNQTQVIGTGKLIIR